jgi:hypothetical protein
MDTGRRYLSDAFNVVGQDLAPRRDMNASPVIATLGEIEPETSWLLAKVATAASVKEIESIFERTSKL